MNSTRRKSQIVLWALAAAAILAAIAVVSYPMLFRQPPPGTEGKTSAYPITTHFSLTDQTGKAVTGKTYEGRWKLVFFGFTHCPDVCPTALNTVAQVLSDLGSSAAKIVPLFVSIDPTRDTPKALADYTAAFDKRIVGLTGSETQVAQAAKSFRAYYARVEEKTAPDGYTMNHSSILYLMGPDGRFVTHFGHNEKPADIAKAIKKEFNK